MRFRKIVFVLVLTVILIFWGHGVYRINHAYPNPENKEYKEGEVTSYKGLQMKVGALEVYSPQQLEEAYPDIKAYYDEKPEEREYAQANTWFVVQVVLENTSEEDITMYYSSVNYWTVEVGTVGNGSSMEEFMVLNPQYSNTVRAGEKMEVLVPYNIGKEYITMEEIEDEDIKIVFSYYPTKSYMLYKSDERQGAD